MLLGKIFFAVNILWLGTNMFLSWVNRKNAAKVDKLLTERLSELNRMRVEALSKVPPPDFRVCITCNKITQGPCPKCQAVLSN